MPSKTRIAFCVAAAALSAFVGAITMILLCGIGICGGPPLSIGMVGTALLLAAGLSASTGALMRAYWPLAAASFSWALAFMLIPFLTQGTVE